MTDDLMPQRPEFDLLLLDREQWEEDQDDLGTPRLARPIDHGIRELAKRLLDTFALADHYLADGKTALAQDAATQAAHLYEAYCLVSGHREMLLPHRDPMPELAAIRHDVNRDEGLGGELERTVRTYDRWRHAGQNPYSLDAYFRATAALEDLGDPRTMLADRRAIALSFVHQHGHDGDGNPWSTSALAERVGLSEPALQRLLERGAALRTAT